MSVLNRAGLVASALVVGCSNDTGPCSSTPSLAFVAGNNQSSTVGETLNQALVVRTSPHQVVQFQSVLDSVDQDGAYVEPLNSTQPQTYLVDTADARGLAVVDIVLGTIAGRARIAVTVTSSDKSVLADTATFTVEPGPAARIVGLAADTTAYFGTTITLRAIVVDQYANPRPDPVTYRVLSGPASVAGAKLTTTAFGVAKVVATAGSLAYTTTISLVPHGRVAAAGYAYIKLAHLDGTGTSSILPNIAWPGRLRFAPNGQSVVYDQSYACDIGDDAPIASTNVSGSNATTILQNPASYEWGQFPSYSRDGAHVYFSLSSYSGGGQLWVASPTLSSTSALGFPTSNDYGPSPSPDGSQLAYFAELSSTSTDLRTLSLQTGAMTSLGVTAYGPQWSPVSNQIAYIASNGCEGPIHIINADGTGDRMLSPNGYAAPFDWSPDGAYLVAANAGTGKIDVINVASGQAVPLPYTFGWESPTWQPTVSP
jgi:hypothetical protein